MASHSSTLAWKIPWTEEPGRLQSMGSWRVGHDWATSLSLITFMHWRRKWQPTLVFLPGESQGWEAWWAAIYGVAQSLTRLKRLSSSSSMHVRDIINSFSTSVFKKLSIFFSVASLTFYFPTTLHHHLVWINCVFEYYRYLYFNFEDYCRIKPIIVQNLLNKTMPYSENGGEIKP